MMSLRYPEYISTIIQKLHTAHNPQKAPIRARFFKAEYAFFQKHVHNKKVLVAGSGLGHDSFELALNNQQIIGIELLPPLVKYAQEMAKKRGFQNCFFEEGDFLQVQYINNYFDVAILNMGTIGNFEDKEKVLKELLRVAPIVYFDFYPPSIESLEIRVQMYREESWTNVRIKERTIISDDGLESTSLHTEEISNIAKNLKANVKFYKLTNFSSMAVLKKS